MALISNEVNKLENLGNLNDISSSESKVSEAAQEINKHHIQIEGWLWKKSRVLKKWRKRWIVLAGNTIYTYKNQKEYNSEPTESIDVENILLIKAHEKAINNRYSFDIELDKKLIFTFGADSNTYRDLWISELNKLTNLNREMLITKESGINGKILSFGCKHFRRNCSYLCSCCNKWYFCSYCHDDVESGIVGDGHELERKHIVAMKCCNCGKEQKPNDKCCKCNLKMSKYYCSVCKFWDNDPNHQLFHCDKCGVCRSGKKTDYIHCDKCGVCLDKTFYKSHKCMEESTKCDCPICGDYLHICDKPVTFWPVCGHAIHVQCMEEFLVYDTLCPICREPWMP